MSGQNNNGNAGNPNGQPELLTGGTRDRKTTPDEGKTFDKDTVFVCVLDCYQDGKRWHAGEEATGRVCPPWFEVKPSEEKKE